MSRTNHVSPNFEAGSTHMPIGFPVKDRCGKKHRPTFSAPRVSAAILTLGALLAFVQNSPAQAGNPGSRGQAAKYLYIWAGDQARLAPDFVTVVNF